MRRNGDEGGPPAALLGQGVATGTPPAEARFGAASTAAQGPVRPRFCVRCGAFLHQGACPKCERTSPTPTRRDHRRVLWAAVAGATVFFVALPSVLWMRAQATDHRLSRERSTQAALRSDLRTEQAAVSNVSGRLASLEAEIHNAPNPAEVAKTAQASVFRIDVGDVSGSAWVVSTTGADSLLVTNFHVVADAWDAGHHDVQLVKGDTQHWPATVEQVSKADDLALIRVHALFPALPRATGDPAIGDPVIAIGSPLGLEGSVSTGIVSGLRHEDGQSFVQFSAPVSPGSSGGPLLDAKGHVIGITRFKAVEEGAEGLGFAIPVHLVCTDLVGC